MYCWQVMGTHSLICRRPGWPGLGSGWKGTAVSGVQGSVLLREGLSFPGDFVNLPQPLTKASAAGRKARKQQQGEEVRLPKGQAFPSGLELDLSVFSSTCGGGVGGALSPRRPAQPELWLQVTLNLPNALQPVSAQLQQDCQSKIKQVTWKQRW